MQVDVIQDPNVAPTKSYKILIIGSAGVGKTCFLMRLCNNTFSHSYTTTLGKYYCFGNRHHVRHDIMQVIHTHTHIYIYTHMHTYIYIYAHMHTHIYIYAHMHTLLYCPIKNCVHASLGVDFKQIKVHRGDDVIALKLWDTAGQEKLVNSP